MDLYKYLVLFLIILSQMKLVIVDNCAILANKTLKNEFYNLNHIIYIKLTT